MRLLCSYSFTGEEGLLIYWSLDTGAKFRLLSLISSITKGRKAGTYFTVYVRLGQAFIYLSCLYFGAILGEEGLHIFSKSTLSNKSSIITFFFASLNWASI
jgi:hypothetical protein